LDAFYLNLKKQHNKHLKSDCSIKLY